MATQHQWLVRFDRAVSVNRLVILTVNFTVSLAILLYRMVQRLMKYELETTEKELVGVRC
jgi:hypothetical protein